MDELKINIDDETAEMLSQIAEADETIPFELVKTAQIETEDFKRFLHEIGEEENETALNILREIEIWNTVEDAVQAIMGGLGTPVEYLLQVGKNLTIPIPAIPEMQEPISVGFSRDFTGDVSSIRVINIGKSGMRIGAIDSGTVNITLKAVDTNSGEEIQNITPLNIEVKIKE